MVKDDSDVSGDSEDSSVLSSLPALSSLVKSKEKAITKDSDKAFVKGCVLKVMAIQDQGSEAHKAKLIKNMMIS
uniref:Uncharacterized protein n=1 Tax=Tetranychus urticae TaxID=32264 RepID=T1JWP5_TETUR